MIPPPADDGFGLYRNGLASASYSSIWDCVAYECDVSRPKWANMGCWPNRYKKCTGSYEKHDKVNTNEYNRKKMQKAFVAEKKSSNGQ